MFVDLFDIKNVFVQNKIGNEWEKSTYNNGKYGTDDTQIYADKNNRLYICSIKEAPARIKFEWNTKLSGKALILNDHWERSYGDIGWSHINTDKILPWYFAINQDNSTQFIGVMTQPNAFIHWQCTFDKISMIADLRCGGNNTILGGRTVEICKIVTFFEDADPFDGLSHFCSLMCQNPKMPLKPVYGGNDWYCSYGNNSHDRILLQAQRISECAGTTENRPYMVIDDGWQIAHGACVGFNGGPWRYCNSKLGDMQRTAQDIKSVGAIPGLWFRPLQTCEYMPKECYIERTISNNRLLRSLDPTHPTVKKYIVSEIQNMVNNGYKLLKHDYSSWDIFGHYGFEFGETVTNENWSFYDKTHTTAEIIKEFYSLIQNSGNTDTLILGCNTFGHLSAGIHNMQRIGDDTSGIDWTRTRKMGVNTLAFRLPQHGTFFSVDADCVGITSKISWDKNEQWLNLLSESTTALFVSIDNDCFGNKQKYALKKAFEKASNAYKREPITAVDWMESPTPTIWKRKSNNKIFKYSWD